MKQTPALHFLQGDNLYWLEVAATTFFMVVFLQDGVSDQVVQYGARVIADRFWIDQNYSASKHLHQDVLRCLYIGGWLGSSDTLGLELSGMGGRGGGHLRLELLGIGRKRGDSWGPNGLCC